MSNKEDRISKEMSNLFKDPKYCRQAWSAVGQAILQNPAVRLPEDYDKNGNETLRSIADRYCYKKLKEDIEEIAKQQGEEPRAVTELEMILGCQIAKARWDTSAATFIRDTLGAKPIDETKVDQTVTNNEYAGLTDEELELLAKHRASKAVIEQPCDNKAGE
jgi:hypothetical protein